MKVKISYSVDIEEIPGRVQKLINDLSMELSAIASSLPNNIEKIDFRSDVVKDVYEKIDTARRKLFILDSRLGDSLIILDDWRSTMVALEAAKINSAMAQEVPHEEAEEGVEDVEI